MEKVVNYEGKEYTIEIKWGGSNYFLRAVGVGGFVGIPMDCLNDIEKIKYYIIQAINNINTHDLKKIELWDGKL